LASGLVAAGDAIVVASSGVARVLIARALHPALRSTARRALPDLVELPHISGRTVIPGDVGDNDLVVLGRPNYLGGFDHLPVRGQHLVIADGAGMEIEDLPPGADIAVLGAVTAGPDAIRGRDQARLLVKRLRQVKGVTVAFMPSTPVAILLLAVDPSRVAAAFDSAAVRALPADYPEFPGGLRVVMPPDMAAAGEDAYAASLQDAIEAASKG
jgi:hypothetical protein